MTRKYRHRGYQDSGERDQPERDRPPRQELTMEERIQRRSMRKATDRNANEVVRCHACGRNVPDDQPIGSRSMCPSCLAPLHCCRACSHFDSSARWQCRAQIAAPVSDKGKANDCTSFSARLVLDVTGRRSTPKSNDPRSQFEDLFRR